MRKKRSSGTTLGGKFLESNLTLLLRGQSLLPGGVLGLGDLAYRLLLGTLSFGFGLGSRRGLNGEDGKRPDKASRRS